MARTKKKTKKQIAGISDELFIGTLLVLASILGIGKFGIVGRFLAGICLYFVGSMYFVFLILALCYGAYLIISSLITRESQIEYFSLKTLGICLIVFSFLILLHKNYAVSENIMKETVDTLTLGYNEIMKMGELTDWTIYGGGIVGAVFLFIFVKLFSYTGCLIVTGFLILIGLVLVIGVDNLSKIKDMFIKEVEIDDDEDDEDKKEKEKEEENDEIEEPKVKTVSSLEELKKPETKPMVKDSEDQIKKYNERLASENYIYPDPDKLLNKPKISEKEEKEYKKKIEKQEMEDESKIIRTFKEFGIEVNAVGASHGPAVSQYEFELKNPGTRVNKILSTRRELELALAKKDVMIQAPIPGKSTIGIEFASAQPKSVSFYEIITSQIMQQNKTKPLMVPLGKSMLNDIEVCNINKMPHLLIAGTTGSGKSVCVNGIICSILMRARPDEVKFVLVDPKVVELSVYNDIPHLMCPVVTDPKQASAALKKMVAEMELRYKKFSETNTKNIEGYNEKIEKENQGRQDDEKKERMPYIVVIIDELSDLMMVAAKDVEDSILRITQKARAAGIHLIVATQRPSTEVITGLIKANIPSRISFAVRSGIDSRTVLDQIGAEKLLGKGDMLFLPVGQDSPTRIQGAFITDEEIGKIIDHVKNQQDASYDDSLMNLNNSSINSDDSGEIDDDDKELYEAVVKFVIESQKASASRIQRRFKIGYNRAARMVDYLEENGIIGPETGSSKPREVLVKLNDNMESSSSDETSEEE